jgi:hypothetical protein
LLSDRARLLQRDTGNEPHRFADNSNETASPGHSTKSDFARHRDRCARRSRTTTSGVTESQQSPQTGREMSQESSIEIQRIGASFHSTIPVRRTGPAAATKKTRGTAKPSAPRSPETALPTGPAGVDADRIPVLTTSLTPLSSASSAPNATAPEPLLRQMRARLAFERASTRLYEAFIAKLDAWPDAAPRAQCGALDRDTLVRFRNEEAAHFELLCEALECMGVDPLAETAEAGDGSRSFAPQGGPATALGDARTGPARALDLLLDAELTDAAGWQQLVAAAHASGLDELARRFEQAHAEEIGHVRQLCTWKAMLPGIHRRVA